LGLINAKSHASLFPAGRGFCSSSDPHAPPRHENLLAVPIAVHDWANRPAAFLSFVVDRLVAALLFHRFRPSMRS
jgi:hypothetical protein